MSQPAISEGRLFIAYPAGQRKPSKSAAYNNVDHAGSNYHLLAVDLTSLGSEYMYLAGTAGHLVSVRQKDGQLGFAYSFRRPMVFQPALVDGNGLRGLNAGETRHPEIAR